MNLLFQKKNWVRHFEPDPDQTTFLWSGILGEFVTHFVEILLEATDSLLTVDLGCVEK